MVYTFTQGIHPFDQLFNAEGLQHIVVSAYVEALQAVGFLHPCRKHDDRNVGYFSDFAQHIKAIDTGHHNVQHQQVNITAVKQVKGSHPI
ncbi:hypothetical protein SDC9_194058 [bioreactor metagenome]|uniref:Uncharacterized protein n=1 Tax=bioreactor metagenome TaxID=1076179 RepID=A0A645I6P7_9ZZZZ